MSCDHISHIQTLWIISDFNSLKHSEEKNINEWGNTFLLIMACPLFRVNPLPESLLINSLAIQTQQKNLKFVSNAFENVCKI